MTAIVSSLRSTFAHQKPVCNTFYYWQNAKFTLQLNDTRRGHRHQTMSLRFRLQAQIPWNTGVRWSYADACAATNKMFGNSYTLFSHPLYCTKPSVNLEMPHKGTADCPT